MPRDSPSRPTRRREPTVELEHLTVPARLLLLASIVLCVAVTFAAVEWMTRNLPFMLLEVAVFLGLVAGGLCFLVGSLLFGGPIFRRDEEGNILLLGSPSAWEHREPLDPRSPEGLQRAVRVTAALLSEADGIDLREVSAELTARGLSPADAARLACLVPAAYCLECLARHGVPLPDEVGWEDSQGRELPGPLEDEPFFAAARLVAQRFPRGSKGARKLAPVACHCPAWQEVERQLQSGRIPKEIELPRILARMP